MIKLDVQEYCHDCPDFEPDVVKPEEFYDSNGKYHGMFGSTFVICKHQKICHRFMIYLQGRLSKGKKERL